MGEIKSEFPGIELNKENLLRFIRNISKADMETLTPSSALIHIFNKPPDEIESMMEELVKDGKLIRKENFGMKFYKIKDST